MTRSLGTSRAALILFSSARTAHHLVAGVPAAARAVHAAARAGCLRCVVAVPQPWAASDLLREETERLAPGVAVEFLAEAAALQPLDDRTLAICGERLPEPQDLDRAAAGEVLPGKAQLVCAVGGIPASLRCGGGIASLAEAGRRIVAATAKPSDGLVSRHLNRRISQPISRWLLRYPGIRPIHATYGTALLAVAMLIALLQGTDAGLVIGALLFQAASIFDGVDGEIARATLRTSPQGARLDSLVDAFTNIGCIGGVALNLAMQGETPAALAGGAGVAMVAGGMFLIARHSDARTGLTFNAVKDRFARRRSRLTQWLTWLTMRDFYALAGAVLIASDLAGAAMYALAAVAAGWLVVVTTVLSRQST